MSGSGSNADAILSQSHRYSNLQFVTICTDKKNSNASFLSQKHHLHYFCHEAMTPCDREAYFQEFSKYLQDMQIDTLIYAGFMKITPSFFVQQFPGINIHPADLTLLDKSGKPKYTGMYAVHDAMKQGERYLASTAHVVDTEVDCGSPILVSNHLILEGCPTQNISFMHEQLKVRCEYLLLPRVLELLSKGLIHAEHTPYQWHEV